jgi:hypothetical protein
MMSSVELIVSEINKDVLSFRLVVWMHYTCPCLVAIIECYKKINLGLKYVTKSPWGRACVLDPFWLLVQSVVVES